VREVRSTRAKGAWGGRAWRVAGLLALAVLTAGPAAAQQWHELYASGVAALRDGRNARAAELLERAIEARPRPGVRVPTYGTNFEPQYFPYLRLAEAYLHLDRPEDAARVLETSARFDVEPAGERAALVARTDELLEAKHPPPEPTPEPTPTPIPEPTPPKPKVADPPAAAPEPVPEPPAPTPTPTPTPSPPRSPTPRPEAATRRPPTSSLEITSDPPGALVVLDDEPVGRTDPETGRLRLRAVTPGRHRLRLELEGRGDFIREIEIGEGPLAVLAVLPGVSTPSSAPSPTSTPASTSTATSDAAPALGGSRSLAPVLGAMVLAVLLGALWVWRSGRRDDDPTLARPSTPSGGRAPRTPGTDELFPVPFGAYTLVRRLGKGGMAAVYEATLDGETFALKRPLTGFLDDDQLRERFLREAALGRTLHHPNIVRIVDRGEVNGVPFFVMELVQGETLRQRLDRDGRLDATFAARLTAQVAEALDYAHNKGVVHRDLKPSNIMLEEPHDTAKVMDYGIARAQRLDGLTTTGAFLGTPSYAAPETVDTGSQPQSDVYSLGVILFEMLTGSLPFSGESAFAVLRSHCSTPPPQPSSLNYALPEALDRLVLRLLEKSPQKRPTAEELLNEISDFLGGTR